MSLYTASPYPTSPLPRTPPPQKEKKKECARLSHHLDKPAKDGIFFSLSLHAARDSKRSRISKRHFTHAHTKHIHPRLVSSHMMFNPPPPPHHHHHHHQSHMMLNPSTPPHPTPHQTRCGARASAPPHQAPGDAIHPPPPWQGPTRVVLASPPIRQV